MFLTSISYMWFSYSYQNFPIPPLRFIKYQPPGVLPWGGCKLIWYGYHSGLFHGSNSSFWIPWLSNFFSAGFLLSIWDCIIWNCLESSKIVYRNWAWLFKTVKLNLVRFSISPLSLIIFIFEGKLILTLFFLFFFPKVS